MPESYLRELQEQAHEITENSVKRLTDFLRERTNPHILEGLRLPPSTDIETLKKLGINPQKSRKSDSEVP